MVESKIRPEEIKGIAVSSALPSMVMVDRDQRPIHNAYNLMDKRAARGKARLHMREKVRR